MRCRGKRRPTSTSRHLGCRGKRCEARSTPPTPPSPPPPPQGGTCALRLRYVQCAAGLGVWWWRATCEHSPATTTRAPLRSIGSRRCSGVVSGTTIVTWWGRAFGARVGVVRSGVRVGVRMSERQGTRVGFRWSNQEGGPIYAHMHNTCTCTYRACACICMACAR